MMRRFVLVGLVGVALAGAGVAFAGCDAGAFEGVVVVATLVGSFAGGAVDFVVDEEVEVEVVVVLVVVFGLVENLWFAADWSCWRWYQWVWWCWCWRCAETSVASLPSVSVDPASWCWKCCWSCCCWRCWWGSESAAGGRPGRFWKQELKKRRTIARDPSAPSSFAIGSRGRTRRRGTQKHPKKNRDGVKLEFRETACG